MELLSPYPDPEDVGLVLLESVAPTYTHTPEVIEPPLIQVRLRLSEDDGITFEGSLEVKTFGSDRHEARDMAFECQQLVLASRATKVDGAVVDNAETDTGPVPTEYGNPAIKLYVGSYRLSFRRS